VDLRYYVRRSVSVEFCRVPTVVCCTGQNTVLDLGRHLVLLNV
jgi:hypothetical protein